MLNFLYGVLATWFLLGLGYSFWWGSNNLYTLLMEIPGGIIEILVEIVCFPCIWFYKVFLRHTIHPVSFEVLAVKKIIEDSKRVFGNVYFCHDKKAKAFVNKIFFFRVDTTFTNPNKPSSPEGNFRIGVDN